MAEYISDIQYNVEFMKEKSFDCYIWFLCLHQVQS